MATKPETDIESGVLQTRTIYWVGALVVAITLGSGALLLWLFRGDGPRTTLDIIRTAGSLGIGTGGGVALILAARRQRYTELDLKQKEKAHHLQEQVAAETKSHQEQVAADNRHDALETRITELYNAAAEQLGSDKAPVRLAGLYALERLADSHEEHRQTMVNLICAYLRMPRTPPGDNQQEDQHYSHEEMQVRTTAQQILADRLRPYTTGKSGSANAKFWGPVDIDLSRAHLSDFSLPFCEVQRAKLDGAQFTGETNFHNTVFNSVANFNNAHFFDEARFEFAHFRSLAHFESVHFESNADFNSSRFELHAIFDGANFSSQASFKTSHLPASASFHDARFANSADFPEVYGGRPVDFSITGLPQVPEEGRFVDRAEFNNHDFFDPEYEELEYSDAEVNDDADSSENTESIEFDSHSDFDELADFND
ncbi:pentapeptide repeat-containing protein [Saccharopolyspora erythraea]|uniref:pentapeptide repeat-containing protein n=1 Tax=Saccharopolyspora erythraea TaxID=1836 RepID=UPI001BA5A469|nr:pentapeptide repeat-containing protein [Saccharopolyspora erythraea]QUG99815.1 pentapeptide repeat-containing protein [Saccharopolyspora erythraea]